MKGENLPLEVPSQGSSQVRLSLKATTRKLARPLEIDDETVMFCDCLGMREVHLRFSGRVTTGPPGS